MPTEKKYKDHAWVLEALKKRQEADHDNRERARMAHNFVDNEHGQWEDDYYENFEGKPRYTFDMVSPTIDQIAGDMERQNFDIVVSPAGGNASKEVAETYDGLIRNIENISGATNIYNSETRCCVTSGLGGWRVAQEYAEPSSFAQDLMIKRVGNFMDRVWFGPHQEPDASDAKYGWVLTGMDPEEYKKRWPRGSERSITIDRTEINYWNRDDVVIVGEFLYLLESPQELALFSNGAVYPVDDNLQAVADELSDLGITLSDKRRSFERRCYSRYFDGGGWLQRSPMSTVFKRIPLVPLYGNWKYNDDKVIYHGVVHKLQDPQRVLNYSLSREIEEGALAPRAKYWMTEEQAEGHGDKLATLNTNTDPVQFYNHDPQVPGPPSQQGGAEINPGLRNISEAMRQIIDHSAGLFAANRGDNTGLQSGVAIEKLQARGETGYNKYATAREIAQRHTAKILIDAIPEVYEPDRQVRLLGEDGNNEMVTIGQVVIDNDAVPPTKHVLHDVTQGTYDVTCTSGPSFKNRQGETVNSLTEIGKVDPSVIELGGDILLKNVPTPGMNDLAARKRQQLFMAGMIPPDQYSEEEAQQAQAMQNQPQEPTPEMVLAMAEEKSAQAELLGQQIKQAEVEGNIRAKARELDLKAGQQKIDLLNAETKRLEANIEARKVGLDESLLPDEKALKEAEKELKKAQAIKAVAEAEAQDVETDVVKSGIMELVGNE